MKIIALAYKQKAVSDFDKSVLFAFLEPAWAGNHIVEVELTMSKNDLEDYSYISVFHTYEQAHMKAYSTQMDEKTYNELFNLQNDSYRLEW